nr:MAG TPA: hypothetical protein [Caudoviricetes sp.]
MKIRSIIERLSSCTSEDGCPVVTAFACKNNIFLLNWF